MDVTLFGAALLWGHTHGKLTTLYESAFCLQLPAQYRCIHVFVGGVQISNYLRISDNKPRWISFIYQQAPQSNYAL